MKKYGTMLYNSGQIIVIIFHSDYKIIVTNNNSVLNNGELK